MKQKKQIIMNLKFLKLIRIILSIIYLLIIHSCTNSAYQKTANSHQNYQGDGKYDISFSGTSYSKKLEGIIETVRRFTTRARYDKYTFSKAEGITKTSLTPSLFNSRNASKTSTLDFATASSIIIYQQSDRIAALTCAHVVDYPDTIITYFKNNTFNKDSLISEIGIKKMQVNSIADLRIGKDLEILAIDHDTDLALLGKTLDITNRNISRQLPTFNYKLGAAKELKWGNSVYLIGFPSAKKMITNGIISSPNRNKKHHFLIDATFNRGFSGGIILAIRDGVPNFELVGIVNSSAAETETILSSDKSLQTSNYDYNLPYKGDIYLQQRKKLIYGIAFGISIESILNFIKKNRATLKAAGFEIEHFFK